VTFPLAFAIGFSVASIPGPTIILIATQTLRHGARAGLVTMTAPLALDALLMLPLGLTLQASLFVGRGAMLLGLVGAAFLLWLGAQSIRAGVGQSRLSGSDPDKLKTRNPKLGTPDKELAPFVKGLLTHVTSPFPYLYWATVGASFIRQGFANGGIAGAAVFPLGFWLGASGFTVIVIYLVTHGKRMLPARLEPYLHYVSGALLVAGAIYLALSVWQGLL